MGASMNETCTTCDENYYGRNCDKEVTCENGVVDGGINGSGECISCYNEWFGEICNVKCLCVNGSGYNSSQCTDIVISNSNVTLENDHCFFDITIIQASIILGENNFIFGNMSSSKSNLFFDGLTIIHGNLILTDSSLYLSNSSIVAEGCIYFSNNTNITIDVSNIAENNSEIVLFRSNKSCISQQGIINYKFINQPKCISSIEVKNESDIDTLFITYRKECGDNLSSPELFWVIPLIIIFSVVGLMIVFVVIVFAIPSIRRKLFPHVKNNRRIEKEL